MLYQIIKAIADSKNISIRQLEINAGIKPGSIYHWDDNKPSYDKLGIVAECLGVTVDEILAKIKQATQKE